MDNILNSQQRANELQCLIQDQQMDMEHDLVFCSFGDALLMPHDIDHVGVHFADDRPEAARILDAEGFDHTTGCDTAADLSHAGAMICAGYAMLEHDE